MPDRRSRFAAPPVLAVDSDAADASVAGALTHSLAELRRSLELPDAFPADVEAEATRVASAVSVDPETAGLIDLRDIPFLTIDPAGSTDLDQALHVERTETGAILHYAIADVPAYVEPGGAIDREARRRGQTLYAPDGRIPLHPPVLSENAASLLPDQDRRAFVWRFELDAGARPVTTTLTRAIVRSRQQWTYEDAQAAIDRGDAPEALLAMTWFGAQRDARESERGGASLDMPEISIVHEGENYSLELDEAVPLEHHNAHVSLLTGMAAAELMLRGGVGILRTMPPAADADVAAFRERAQALGLPWHEGTAYGDYLRTLPRTPAARAVRETAASLFRGAGYAVFDGEPPALTVQSAIGAPYAHTTAPLRRLVDRWTLVICEALANARPVPDWARSSLAELPALMGASSQRASALAAGAVDRVEAAVLSGREGTVFEALVLSVRGAHARIQLVDPPVETSITGPGLTASTTVRVRITDVSIADGTVVVEPAPPR